MLCAPSQPTTYCATAYSPSASSTTTSIGVLAEPDHLGALDDVHAQLAGALHQQLLGAALRHDEDHRVPGAELPQIDAGARCRPDLADHHSARHQGVTQPSGVEELERPGVHGERAGDVRLLGAPLQHPAADTAQRQFTGEHETGRAGADHDDVGGTHSRLLGCARRRTSADVGVGRRGFRIGGRRSARAHGRAGRAGRRPSSARRRRDPEDPPVESDDQVEQVRRVPPEHRQAHAGDQHEHAEQPEREHRWRRRAEPTQGADQDLDDQQVGDGEQPLDQDERTGQPRRVGDVEAGGVIGGRRVNGGYRSVPRVR